MKQGQETPGGGFLPDFCAPHVLLVLVLAAQLLALLLVLARGFTGTDFWVDLGVISLFLQWIALVSAALICGLRQRLSQLRGPIAATVAYVALVLTTLLLSTLAWSVAEGTGLGEAWMAGDPVFFLLRNTAISAIVSALVLRYFYVQHQWKENVRREATARIEALQARIRPHFLFNSLNTVAALIAIRPELAERAVEDLSDLFRASLNDDPDGVTLADEMALAERYLHLEALRLGDRLRLEWNVPSDCLDEVRVPRLIIQPLVENAVYHGIETRPDGGRVEVTVTDLGSAIQVLIRNPLPDEADSKSSREGHRMALDNVTQRLALALGPEAKLDTERSHGEFITRLRLPKLEE